jgi:hypothetical protein
MRACSVLAAALLLSFSHVATAQVVRIAGTVRDESGRPVKGATIVAGNPDHTPATLTASTDDKGRFGMIGLRRGTWIFSIEAPGFEAIRLSRELASIRPNPPLDVRLQKGTAPAPPPPLASVRASDIQARLDLAESKAGAGDLDGAIEVYRDIVTRVPALTAVYLRIGELYERQPDVERALDAYRRLAALEPDNANARAAIARLTRQ